MDFETACDQIEYLAGPFEKKFNALSGGLARLESTYQAARDAQRGIIDASNSMKEALAFLDSVTLPLDRSGDPLLIPWPSPASPGGILSSCTITEWRQFILGLTLHLAIPGFISERYRRAQRAYFLAWIDGDFVKLGELIALGALEHALRERYAVKMRRTGGRSFRKLLEYLGTVRK